MAGVNCNLVEYTGFPCYDLAEALRKIERRDDDGTWHNKGYIIEQFYQADTTDAEKDCIEGETDEFDGTGTAAVVGIVSADANDDGSPVGTGTCTTSVLGIASDDYTTETITNNGKTAVNTTTTWQRIIGMWSETVGTGGANAGAITMHEKGGAVSTYATIAAGDNCTESLKFWIAPGYKAMVLKFTCGIEAAVAAGSDVDTKLGVQVSLEQDKGSFACVDKVIACATYDHLSELSKYFEGQVFPRGDVDTEIVSVKFTDEALDGNALEGLTYHVKWLVWKP